MVAPDGSIYATDQNNGNGVIFKVDPTTGNRTIVSGEGVRGATFGGLSYGIAIYPCASSPVPEPAWLAPLGVGALTLLGFAQRKRKELSTPRTMRMVIDSMPRP